jgi:hypothetical protein
MKWHNMSGTVESRASTPNERRSGRTHGVHQAQAGRRLSTPSPARQEAAQRGLEASQEYSNLLDRTYADLTDPAYASRYMSQAASRTLGGFGGQARGGAQIAAMGDIGMRSAEESRGRREQALGIKQEQAAAATESETIKLDALDTIDQIMADNRDASGFVTPAGQREIEREINRIELTLGANAAQEISRRVSPRVSQEGPGWLDRLFGARG